MEYVDGEPLREFCEKLTVPQKLALFVKICSAVAYAHRELVIHRDLKPGNILVTADGTPKLLDFGVGKLLATADDGGLEASGKGDCVTQAFGGVPMFTLEYASPEQLMNEGVGTGADVYALGAILYEILTGVKAHQFPDMSPLVVRHVILEQPSTKPSTAVAKARPADARLRKTLSGDLDNIVLKAMNKDRDRRYESAQALAEDIQRYLDGFPVQARPDSAGYRLRKFVLRNRLAVLAAAVLIVTLTVAMVATIREKRQAERRFQQMRGLANQFLVDVDKEMRKTPGTTKAREVMVRTALASLDGLANEAGGDASILMDLAEAYEKAAQVQGVPGYQNLGHVDEALASQRKSVDLFRQLIRIRPNDPEVRRRFSDQLSNYGRVLMLEGDLEPARQILEEGLRLVEHPANYDDAVVASYNITHLGRILTTQGKHEESEKLIREGIAMIAPYGDRARAARYQLESDLADELRLNGYPKESETVQMPLLEARRRNHLSQPQDTIRMRRFGEALHAAALLFAGGLEPGIADRPKAVALLEESRLMFAKMRDADSNNMSGPVELAIADMELARMLPPGARALALLEEASQLLEAAPVRSALMPGLRRKARVMQAASLRALGKATEAGKLWQPLDNRVRGDEWFEHLVSTQRWKEAVDFGEALVLPDESQKEFAEALRASWIRSQLESAYTALGASEKAARHRALRRKTWETWAGKRPANPQVRFELQQLAAGSGGH